MNQARTELLQVQLHGALLTPTKLMRNSDDRADDEDCRGDDEQHSSYFIHAHPLIGLKGHPANAEQDQRHRESARKEMAEDDDLCRRNIE
jgi:hypothetical protein